MGVVIAEVQPPPSLQGGATLAGGDGGGCTCRLVTSGLREPP